VAANFKSQHDEESLKYLSKAVGFLPIFFEKFNLMAKNEFGCF
jgi:hypothetical protein